MNKEVRKILRKQKLVKIKLEFLYHKQMFTSRASLGFKVKYLFMQAIFRRCEAKGYRCGGGRAYFAPMNTMYEDELSNWHYGCRDCHEEINDYWEERWAEYYSGRL